MSNYGESLVMPADSSKPDLGSLRIHDGQRAKSTMGRRVLYASIPVVIFGAIVATAFALRNQKPVVEVATVAKPDSEGPLTALNASGYITPRRRASPDDSSSTFRPANSSISINSITSSVRACISSVTT